MKKSKERQGPGVESRPESIDGTLYSETRGMEEKTMK